MSHWQNLSARGEGAPPRGWRGWNRKISDLTPPEARVVPSRLPSERVQELFSKNASSGVSFLCVRGEVVLCKRWSRFLATGVCAAFGPTAFGARAEALPSGLGLQDLSGGVWAQGGSLGGAMQEEEVKCTARSERQEKQGRSALAEWKFSPSGFAPAAQRGAHFTCANANHRNEVLLKRKRKKKISSSLPNVISVQREFPLRGQNERRHFQNTGLQTPKYSSNADRQISRLCSASCAPAYFER